MAKVKISEFNSNPALNTDIDSINIAEGCSPSGINDAIRELMSQLKDWQSGTSNDPYVVGSSGSLTLNQGTANGVAYLNGSKVVTSGSGLVFDGSNLGLGVTPSAWNTGKSIQANNASFMGTTSAAYFSSNWYYNSGDKYVGNGYATSYQQYSGLHAWFTAPSGTAGNAITFTQAMTLDASGNLLVGATSSSGKLTIKNPSVSGAQTILAVQNAVSTGTIGSVTFNQDTDAFGVINNTAGGALFFSTNATERARIDSSGNLLVGTTSTTNTARFACNNTAGTRKWGFGTLGSSTPFYVVDDTTGSGVQLTAGASAWSSFSDERNKTQLKPFENAVEKVCTLRTGTGRYLTDAESVSRSFLIAQDVQKVLPEAVDVGEDEQGTLALRYTDVIPLLVAAIKELKAENDSLKARLDAANL